jgi:hypothetical protein
MRDAEERRREDLLPVDQGENEGERGEGPQR